MGILFKTEIQHQWLEGLYTVNNTPWELWDFYFDQRVCWWSESAIIQLNVIGTCSTPPYGVERFGSQHVEGPRATRTSTSPGGGPENYNNRPVAGKTHFSLQMSHCHSVCLFWTTIYPLQMLKFKVWVRTFGTILDSPFVLAFVLSPSSPPFPLAHCELPRREKKKECYTASAD